MSIMGFVELGENPKEITDKPHFQISVICQYCNP